MILVGYDPHVTRKFRLYNEDSGKIIEARNVNFHEEDDPVFKSKEEVAKPQEPPSEDSGDDDSDPSYSVTEDEDGHLSYSVTEDDDDILNLHADGSITDGEKNEDPRPGTSSSSDKNKLTLQTPDGTFRYKLDPFSSTSPFKIPTKRAPKKKPSAFFQPEVLESRLRERKKAPFVGKVNILLEEPKTYK
ncbi:unnamed protein product [Allacma fusca]|uniref:Retroviral polymerase SH3-like domain-containing protein n=1 Tax=Allacma fusca TaxID=39272 RepID=A0A8J2KC65_9HEXA|nr:unnamed protein product [Allacma fusca]